jgi:hypothetical protein
MYELNIGVCIICVVFCIIGVLVCNFEMYDLMIAYHKMSKEKKQKISIEKYAKVMRNVLFSSSFMLFLGMFVFQYIGIYKYFMPVYYPIIIIGLIIFMVIYHKSS